MCYNFMSFYLLLNVTMDVYLLQINLTSEQYFTVRQTQKVYKNNKYFVLHQCVPNKHFQGSIQTHTLRSETIFGKQKPFKNDEKCFLFHLKVNKSVYIA